MVQVRGYSEDDVDVLADELALITMNALTRVVTRAGDELKPAVTAASSAGIGPGDLSVLTEYWLSEVNGEIMPFVSQVYTGSAVSVAIGLADGFPLDANPGVPLLPDDFTQTFLKTVVGDFVSVGDDAWEDVREILIQGVKHGESIEQIAAKMRYVTTFSTRRATEIARTVTHAAAESGSIAQIRFVGYTDEEVTKQWLATDDARTRPSHNHADDQRVTLNEKFTVGGASLDFPGDPSGPRAETRNCRCTMTFDIDDAPKLRCDASLIAAPQASYCVVPTPQVDVSHIPQPMRDSIFKAFSAAKISPAWGGAKIHKVIQKVRDDSKASYYGFTQPLDDTITEWHILAVVDSMKSPAGGKFTPKFSEWLASAAGKKAAPNVPPPPTAVVAPSALTQPAVTLRVLPPIAPKPDPSDIYFTGQILGSHGAQVWKNGMTGERWLFKPQPKFATDIDIATAKIQSKALDTRPGVYSIKLNGQSGSIQYMFDSSDAFPKGSFDPLKLSADDIAILQQGQIFDWMISNFDTHSGQWIRLQDGKLFGTDKGQAFKFFGSDKLDWDYVPVYPLGSDKLTYSTMWKAYIAGKDVDMQDPTTGPLGEYIDRLMAIPDDEYKAILSSYAQFKPDPAAFLAQAVARKNSLKKDFQDFWARAQAERAKHVKPPPPPPTAPPTAPVKIPASVAADGDISGYDAAIRQLVLDAWIDGNNGVKITPAWGGAKLWKVLEITRNSLHLQWALGNMPGKAPNELQILRILDELGGFKGKPKTYESVVRQWLDSPAGKKAVPTPPSVLAKPAVPAAPKVTVAPPTSVIAPAQSTLDASTVLSNPNAPQVTAGVVFKDIHKYSAGDVIAYAQDSMTLTYYRLSKGSFIDEVDIHRFANGTWELVDSVASPKDLNDALIVPLTWKMKLPTGGKSVAPAVTSKIPGKMPGDKVTISEIETSRYLWADGEVIAEGKTYATGVDQLISDGKGGVLFVHQPIGYKYVVGKTYPAHKPLPKSISGQTQWNLGPSAITGPTHVTKASPFPNKAAGEIVAFDEIDQASMGTTIAAYAYDSSTEYRIVFGKWSTVTIESRALGTSKWVPLYDDTSPSFKSTFVGKTWYAATDKGEMPDAYKAIVPAKAPPPVGTASNVASNIPGKNFGDPVIKSDIAHIAHTSAPPPGTILAEAMDAGGTMELRFIVDATGYIKWQTRVKGGDWTDSQAAFSTFFNSADAKGWYASVGQVTSVAKAAKAPLPTHKKVKLTGTNTHIPGKVVGDVVTADEIMATGPLMVDGQIVATKKSYGMTYRLFWVDGKLIEQKQSKSGAWIGTKIIDNKWNLSGLYGWKAANDEISAIHLKNAFKFVHKKTTVKPAVKASWSSTPTPTPVSTFVPQPIDLTPWNATARIEIYTALHSKSVNTHMGAADIWDQIKAVQAELVKKDPKFTHLSEIAILRIYDAERAKKLGVTDTHVLEAKIVTWLQTPGGKVHVGKKMSAPVLANDVPKPMHALDDPSNPDPDTQKYTRKTNQELLADRIASHAKYGGWVGQQKTALREYTGGVFSSWNAAIRLGNISAYRARIIAAQQGMRPSTIPMLLIRKASFAEFNDPSIRTIADLQARVGQRFVTRGFSSSSNTGTWSGTVRFEIECPIGTPMARVQDFSHYKRENETLLAAHLIYKILSVSPDAGGGTKVRVRVVGAYDPQVGSW